MVSNILDWKLKPKSLTTGLESCNPIDKSIRLKVIYIINGVDSYGKIGNNKKNNWRF